MNNIISKYGKSTKRDKANELGAMGIGWKSPLAYTSSFYFVCRKDGIERKYMMYEGEEVNSIDLLYEIDTKEENGVKVIVPISYADRYTFFNKIKEQLAYFKDVYFNIDSSVGYINNEFKITKHELFQYSEICNSSRLHLCLDDVYYPIDFDKLGIEPIKANIAIRCSLSDGIYPVPNREQLVYSTTTKQLILNKIKQLANYILTEYNNEITNIKNFNEVVDYYTNSSIFNLYGKRIYVSAFVPHSDITLSIPKMEGIELLDLKSIVDKRMWIFHDYVIKYRLIYKRFNENKHHATLYYDEIDKNIYVFTHSISNKVKDYLRNQHENEKVIFVKKGKNIKLRNAKKSTDDCYYGLLDLKNYPKSQWRQIITEFQLLKKTLTDKFINADEIVIPTTYKKNYVSRERTTKLEGEITLNVARSPLKSGVKNCIFEPKQFVLNDLHKNKGLIIYGKKDEEEVLDKYYDILKRYTVVNVSDREFKKLENTSIHNLMNIKTFMEGENKSFKKLVTAYLINNLIGQYKNTFYCIDSLKFINSDLHSKCVQLKNYKSENYVHCSVNIYLAMLEIANQQQLFDMTIYNVYLKIKEILERLSFIETLIKNVSQYNRDKNNEYLCIIRDMCKYHRFRIDAEYYVSTEKLTKEVLEQLCNN